MYLMSLDSVAMGENGLPGPERTGVARGMGRRTFDRWKHAAHAIGVVQTRVFMLGIYAFAVVPVGCVLRFTSDPLRLRAPREGNWTDCLSAAASLERARQQF